jgi:hypothetical protein
VRLYSAREVEVAGVAAAKICYIKCCALGFCGLILWVILAMFALKRV